MDLAEKIHRALYGKSGRAAANDDPDFLEDPEGNPRFLRERHRDAMSEEEVTVDFENETVEFREVPLEPGKASAIVNGMFREAERLGIYKPTAKHALTQLVEEIERLREKVAILETNVKEMPPEGSESSSCSPK